jgi:NDP-sugar pyrophosphorylase family protein
VGSSRPLFCWLLPSIKTLRSKKEGRLLSQAFILAGGRGKRLKPFTEIQPKTLLPLVRGSFLDHLIQGLLGAGFTRICVAAGHLGLEVERYVAARYPKCKVLIQTKGIGTAGDALLAIEQYVADDFLVVHGDHFFQIPPFQGLCASHKSGSVTFLVHNVSNDSLSYGLKCLFHRESGTVYLDTSEIPTDRQTEEMLIVDGCMGLPRTIFEAIRRSRKTARGRRLEMRDTFAFIAKNKLIPLHGIEISSWYANVNDFASYAQLLKRLNDSGPVTQ